MSDHDHDHDDEEYACDCGAMFDAVEELKSHVKESHPDKYEEKFGD
jgi:hypothetical protein